ncbi:MAG: hypothetical protein CL847_06535 [Crocinitomicaceae bacterium]|nr:hypothetical protein [Crocinitomicaceae bacterium]
MLNSDLKTILLDTLQSHWGYNSLRPNQEAPVFSLASGTNTIALMPTGAGKSLCFQLPALFRGGLCLVISPLIALMEDQTHQIKLNNARAATLTSSLGRSGIDRVLENACLGKLDFLYLSPERLEDPMFKARISRLDVQTIVVDEAHCISEWGHDFRPEYSKISSLKEHFPQAVWGAYTATATKDVLDDIIEKLKLEKVEVFTASSRRPNLAFQVSSWGDPEVEILHEAITLNTLTNEGSGLLYVRTRALADKFAERLVFSGINAESFHAGLSSNTKLRRQRDWIKGKTKVMACTSAFGMGIDKSDVRWVLHFNLPTTLEAYTQEVGRAGRDGELSHCIAFIDDNLKQKNINAFSSQFPSIKDIQNVYQSIANQGRIAIGDKPNYTTLFSLENAKETLQINISLIHSSLNVLQKKGLIEVVNSISEHGSVVWLGGKNRILNEIGDLKSKLINELMRISTSPTQEIEINIRAWSSRLQCDNDNLINALSSLDATGLINWKPYNGELKIVWPMARINASKVTINTEEAKSRVRHLRDKQNAVYNYVDSIQCRSFELEKYFDSEAEIYQCGKCDNCTLFVDEITCKIKERIPEYGVNAYELIRSFPAGHRDKISSTLRHLLDTNVILAKGNILFISSVA